MNSKSKNSNRQRLWRRQKGRCAYCGVQMIKKLPGQVGVADKGKTWTLDHVHPQAKGGPSTRDNLVLACRDCNQKKADRLLDRGHYVRSTS